METKINKEEAVMRVRDEDEVGDDHDDEGRNGIAGDVRGGHGDKDDEGEDDIGEDDRGGHDDKVVGDGMEGDIGDDDEGRDAEVRMVGGMRESGDEVRDELEESEKEEAV